MPGVVRRGAEQPGDLLQADFRAGIQADGQGVVRVVRTKPRGPRSDDTLAEDGCLGGPLPDRVELLQRVDQRGERVTVWPVEPALSRPDTCQHRFARCWI